MDLHTNFMNRCFISKAFNNSFFPRPSLLKYIPILLQNGLTMYDMVHGIVGIIVIPYPLIQER